MGTCGAEYRDGEGRARCCALDAGHRPSDHYGPPSRAARATAKAAAQRQLAELEASQRAATEAAIGAKLEHGASLTAAEFAATIVAIAGEKGATARAIFATMRARTGGELVVNGRPAGVREIKQAAARLARDGRAQLDGDVIRAA